MATQQHPTSTILFVSTPPPPPHPAWTRRPFPGPHTPSTIVIHHLFVFFPRRNHAHESRPPSPPCAGGGGGAIGAREPNLRQPYVYHTNILPSAIGARASVSWHRILFRGPAVAAAVVVDPTFAPQNRGARRSYQPAFTRIIARAEVAGGAEPAIDLQ